MIWILLATGLLLSFLLSGLESAVLAVNPVRMRHYAKSQHVQAQKLERLFVHKERLLTSILVLNSIINLFGLAVVTNFLVEHAGSWGYLLAFAVYLPIYLVWVEMVPKTIFRQFPFRALARFLPLLRAIYFVVGPFIHMGALLLSPLTNPNKHTGDAAETREEFISLTKAIEKEGALGESQRKMIQNVVNFERVKVRDIMIPLSRVRSVPADMPITTILGLAQKTDIDQFPVMSAKGDLVGLVKIFDVLVSGDFSGKAIEQMRLLFRAKPDEMASHVIQRLRRSGTPLAAVVDEAGKPLGIVSSEDLVRQMIART